MEIFEEDYENYSSFLQSLELDSCYNFNDASLSACNEWSSSDGGTPSSSSSPAASKNTANSGRSRRRTLNERLYALRSEVPNITKMDKSSIIKDAISYIESLHDEEKKLQAEILQLESSLSEEDYREAVVVVCSKPKRAKLRENNNGRCYASSSSATSSHPIEVLELKVTDVGEKTIMVSLTCNRRRDTMAKLFRLFESLKIRVITATVTALSERLFKTLFIEAGEVGTEVLRSKIEAGIDAMNGLDRPVNI